MQNNKRPLFSVVIPVYNVEIPWLEKAIGSVTEQTFTDWELCLVDDCSTKEEVPEYLRSIENEKIKVILLDKNQGISGATNEGVHQASGKYIALMDNDDEITPDALKCMAEKITSKNADILYSDQDIIDEKGQTREPLFKPDWSPELVLSQMYIGHLLVFKKDIFEKVGGFRSEFNGSQDYDLFLRMSEKTDRIVHIPEILYHWRAIPTSTAANPESKPYAQIAGQKAVQEHMDRLLGEGKAQVNETADYFVYDVRYKMETEPKVSVIMPTKDQAGLLKQAIDSIEEKTSYKNYEIILLDNNSEEEATFQYFKEVQEQYDNVFVHTAAFPFNWSKLNNYGMEKASGDVYIFLNNDIKIIAEEWMTRLVEKAVRPQIGVVGGLLLYEDDTIQHAGVIVGMGGWADHVFKGMKPVHYGSPFLSPMVTRNVSAVTGACMAISKETIKNIGKFNENFIICGSDIEICLKAMDYGYRNVYDPYVTMYHYESKTRDSFIPEVDFKLSDKMYHKYRVNGDPYYNMNLDYYKCQPEAVVKEEKENEDHLKYRKIVAGMALQEENVDTHVAEINPYHFRKCDHKKRINILLPSINPEHVFGGISTALKFFEQLADELGYDRRIILVDAVPSQEAISQYEDRYTFVPCGEDSDASRQIVPYSIRPNLSIPVSENDYFMFTGWWTAHCAQEAYGVFERREHVKPHPFINFIQDYEPGFYPWSTRYLLADATYKHENPQIAIFNTTLLQEYFHFNHYEFFKEFAFEPVLNDQLKASLDGVKYCFNKKKQVLVYGRPGTERNAFKLVVGALKKWVCLQKDIEDWDILSAGEAHDDVYLGNGKYLRAVGKLTLDEYANVLKETFAGISLMVSPHPSYPPLEMSVFGAKVITNTFANKDMSTFNDNMVSLKIASPDKIAEKLNEVCDGYQKKVLRQYTNEEYLENKNVFGFIKEIKEILENEGK